MSQHQQIDAKWETRFLETEIVLPLQMIQYSPPIGFLQTLMNVSPIFHGSAYADSPCIASIHHYHFL